MFGFQPREFESDRPEVCVRFIEMIRDILEPKLSIEFAASAPKKSKNLSGKTAGFGRLRHHDRLLLSKGKLFIDDYSAKTTPINRILVSFDGYFLL